MSYGLSSPGIIWMDLDKIATKGVSAELSSTRSHKPQKKCCFGHLREMHWPKKPFVAFLSHWGPDLGYNDWTKAGYTRERKVMPIEFLYSGFL